MFPTLLPNLNAIRATNPQIWTYVIIFLTRRSNADNHISLKWDIEIHFNDGLVLLWNICTCESTPTVVQQIWSMLILYTYISPRTINLELLSSVYVCCCFPWPWQKNQVLYLFTPPYLPNLVALQQLAGVLGWSQKIWYCWDSR